MDQRRGDLCELRNLATKWYMLIVIKKLLNVTLFGKTRLNENSVEPFFHFNAFWKRSNALQIIFNAFENIDNVRERKRNALKIILNSF